MAMKKKTMALWTVGLALALLAVSLLVFKKQLVEEYFLWKLSSEDRDERIAAMQRLGEMRSERAISAFIDEMKEGGTSFAPPLVKALSAIGPKAVDPLAEIVKDKDLHEVIRKWAINALNGIGPEAKSASEELIAISGEQDFPFRVFAILALAAIDPTSPKTVGALRRLSTDHDPQVREAAEDALKRIEAENQNL